MKVVCIDKGFWVNTLTEGKEYEAKAILGSGWDNDILNVLDNTGEWHVYFGERFTLVKD